MGEDKLLVDTDVLLAYLNRRSFREFLEDRTCRVYYSAVTKKELLSKPGLKASERDIILRLLSRFRQVHIDSRVTRVYSELRFSRKDLAQPDALIAASAMARGLPLLTLNVRHFSRVNGLSLVRCGESESQPPTGSKRRRPGRR